MMSMATVTVLFLCGISTARAQRISFARHDVGTSSLNAGTAASIVMSDFNRDGKMDLALVDGRTLTILLGNGDGNFQVPKTIMATNPVSVTVGDFNNDGKSDLIVGRSTLQLFLGNGDGTFQSATSIISSGGGPFTVGDFNGDGRLDLAVTPGLLIMLGRGDGKFSVDFGYTDKTSNIASGDFNGDGIPDLVTDTAIRLGTGDGRFQSGIEFKPFLDRPLSIVSADFNGDGKLDLAVTVTPGEPLVQLLLGNGNGTFQSAVNSNLGRGIPIAVSVADVDRDGKQDLVAVTSLNITVLFGKGDGTFEAPQEFGVGSNPGAIAIGDLNGDGRLDLVTVNKAVIGTAISLSVLLNDTPVKGSIPVPIILGLKNAASYVGDSISPGEIITIFGSGIGPDKLTSYGRDASGKITTSLAMSRILFDGIPAPILYTSSSQLSAIVPYAVDGKTRSQLEVEYMGVKSTVLTVPVSLSAVGLFTSNASGQGGAAALNQDSSVNSASSPADRGAVIVLYATGEGQTNPGGIDGIFYGNIPPQPNLPISVSIDGNRAEILYAGEAPGAVAGLLQVNARIPLGIRGGTLVPVELKIGNATSQPGVTIAISNAGS